MGKSGKKAAVKQAQANQKYYDEMVRDYRARTGAKAEQIEPFIKQLLQWGIDPQAFLQSSVGQAFLRPMQEATARNFAGARESLIDVGAGQGWSPATGIMSGPLANLFGLESLQQSANVSELLRRAPEMGLLGAQLAQGQQQIFNPLGPGGLSLGYNANIFKNDPNNTLDIVKVALGALSGAATGGFGSSIGGLFGKPK